MGRKCKAKAPANDPKALVVEARSGERPDRLVARQLVNPSVQAASTIQTFEHSEFELHGFIGELKAQAEAVHAGDMRRPEEMLIAQAHTLNEIFQNLTRRAAGNLDGGYLPAAEIYLRLALKAQSQCRATLETLSAVKNPPIVYARQANVTTGPQQVNNGLPFPRTRESETPQNKLLEQTHGARLDAGTASTTGGTDSDLAAVGAIYRSEDEGR